MFKWGRMNQYDTVYHVFNTETSGKSMNYDLNMFACVYVKGMYSAFIIMSQIVCISSCANT